MKDRVYICHTFYHVYISCLKELALPQEKQGNATLLLSTMSNDFGDLNERAKKCGLFEEVYMFEEKEESHFPELAKYHTDKGNIVLNMIQRMKYTKLYGKLEAPFVPVDLKQYGDIYVFCDSDPIGYYLNTHKIYYHALEDGLDCIRYLDSARYDNRGHFKLKAWMSEHNFIFIQNGYGKYCLDMEVNNISVLPYPCKKYIELPRQTLVDRLTKRDKAILVKLFVKNVEKLLEKLAGNPKEENVPAVLVLTEPLCDLETRKRIFSDIVEQYGEIDGKKAKVLIKPHPRDVLDYEALFPDQIVISGKFPMEILNYLPDMTFGRVVSVLTPVDAIAFAKEKLFLGRDFLDLYEAPEVHRQNEHI